MEAVKYKVQLYNYHTYLLNFIDTEFKPDLVWPFTCKITSTEVSPDTNVIAIGLENGNLVVWDRHMGKLQLFYTLGCF